MSEVLPPAHSNKQKDFAQNLGGTPLGLALYSPLTYKIPPNSSIYVPAETQTDVAHLQQGPPERSRVSGKVGDVAFFTKEGQYQWLRNAFDEEVHILLCEALT